MMTTPQINPEFQSLIPRLTTEELTNLESQIVAEGCREPIKTWQGWVIDGHNRLAICQRHGLPYQTQSLDGALSSREDAINWMITHQLGRRNLGEKQKSALRGKQYLNEKSRKGGQAGNSNAGKNDVATVATSFSEKRTRAKLANDHGVSNRTITGDAQYAASLDLLSEHGIDPRDAIEQLSRADAKRAANAIKANPTLADDIKAGKKKSAT